MTASTSLSTPTVAVVGSTGELGTRVVEALAARGIAQCLPVRAPRRAPRPPRAQVVEVGGYTDRAGMERALHGIDALLVVPSVRQDDPLTGYRAMFAAARAAGVGRVVFLSLAVDAALGVLPRAESYAVAERDLIESGLDWTIARMNVALDLLPMAVARDGRLRRPSGGDIAPVAYDDLAEAMARLLLSERFAGQVLHLTGPQTLPIDAVAAVLSEHAPAAVRAVPCAADEQLAGTQSDAWWRELQPAIEAGGFARVSDDLQMVLNRPPLTLDAWLRRHPFALVHVGFGL